MSSSRLFFRPVWGKRAVDGFLLQNMFVWFPHSSRCVFYLSIPLPHSFFLPLRPEGRICLRKQQVRGRKMSETGKKKSRNNDVRFFSGPHVDFLPSSAGFFLFFCPFLVYVSRHTQTQRYTRARTHTHTHTFVIAKSCCVNILVFLWKSNCTML